MRLGITAVGAAAVPSLVLDQACAPRLDVVRLTAADYTNCTIRVYNPPENSISTWPSSTASAIFATSNLMARIASSLDGIT